MIHLRALALEMGNLSNSELRRLLGWLSRDLEKAVATLTVRQRECIVLIYVGGHTEEETAAKMGIDQSTVTQHKNAAIHRLRKMFQ